MTSMKNASALRRQLLAGILLAFVVPLAHAADNIFQQAWSCAEGSAQATYELAGKGAKALQVLGTAPKCVAYATSGDIPLYATTGVLFTLNAIDSSIVSSSNCVQSVKANAVVPMGKLLNGALPGGLIPADVLNAGSQEAADQLWEFMATAPPPLSTAIERIDCGCTFLEAGISVQNLVEIFTIIAEAGASCDAVLDNVPGYQTVKAGVQAGATGMNNLGEDIFTSQVQHKDVEAYYFQDFGGGGGVDAYASRSHAAARILNPGHDWRSQEGASFLSETVVKLGGGANAGAQTLGICKEYFDNHKMSASNAAKVCEAMAQRFEHDYKSMVERMKAQDLLVKQLDQKLALRREQALAACGKAFPPDGAQVTAYGYVGGGPNVDAHNHCADTMKGAVGSLEWHSPYDVVGGLGFPVDPADVDAKLAAGKPYFFMTPIAMRGAKKIAWQAFENNGGAAGPAAAQGLLAYQMIQDKTFKDAHAIHKKTVLMIAQKKAEQVKAVAGFAFPNCPVDAGRQDCIDALGVAVDICLVQAYSVPLSGEFPKPAEQAKINAIESKCAAGYVALAKAHAARKNQDVTLRKQLACPGPGEPLRLNCLKDLQGLISSCQGGLPQMSTGFFATGKFAQDPVPEMGCDMAAVVFKDKWTADDEQIARINGAYSEGAQACIKKVPDFGACQKEVGALADSCRTDLTQIANILLGSLSLQSEEMGNAKQAIAANADACIAQMLSIPAAMGAGREAEVLMLGQYGPRCARNEACKALLSSTLRQCQAPAGGASATGPRVQSQRASLAGVAAVDGNRIKVHSARLVKAANPVTAALNNPTAFPAGVVNAALADTAADDVLKCKDQLEAALAKFDFSRTANVGVTPTATQLPVFLPGASAAALVAPLARVVPAAAQVSIQPGTDRMGGDYRGFAMAQADPQQCRQACADENACRSFTYVNPGLKGPQAMCFLKNTVPPATRSNCCTSGEKQQAAGTGRQP